MKTNKKQKIELVKKGLAYVGKESGKYFFYLKNSTGKEACKNISVELFEELELLEIFNNDSCQGAKKNN